MFERVAAVLSLSLRQRGESAHALAVLQALFVTVLWSSSYVLIDVGLRDIPPLTFAGLRYVLASACLLPVFLRRGDPSELAALDRSELGALVGLGVLLYAVTQGAQFVGLVYLQSATVALVLTFTPVVVAAASVPALGERPTSRQLLGLVVLLAGAVLYFQPLGVALSQRVGLAVVAVGLFANAAASVLGRRVNRDHDVSPLGVTAVSMTVGSVALLGTGVAVQGLPALDAETWLLVGWLAVVNTAFAFTLWNRTLQTLTAVESSAVNNTMLVQIAVLGWVFLGESLSAVDVVGLLFVAGGTLVVQVGRASSRQ